MSGLDDVYNQRAGWRPRMSPPASFSRTEIPRFQRLVDGITGTRDARPIVQLAWAPDELRWMPHRMGDDTPGYTFPIFYSHRNADRELVSAPRYVLLQRAEPQHYAATWELGRYGVIGNAVWDQRGPCPAERYTELKIHSYHDGECCPCHGDLCECLDELHDHCWGRYADPDDNLLNWVRKTARESEADTDVKPDDDIRYFSAPKAQREVASAYQHAEEREAEPTDLDRDAVHHFLRQPVSTNGLRRTESGLYLLN